MSHQTKTSTRKVEAQIEIAAPPEAVWRALTEASEITRWFAFDASTTPGAGGKIEISWGGDYKWPQKIEIWEPNKHLRTTAISKPSAAKEGDLQAIPVEIAIDYFLETSGGNTILRLVHSGFGSGTAWDEEYEGVKWGWAGELPCLRHYLEHHQGKQRHCAWLRASVPYSREEAWQRLTAPNGLLPGLNVANKQPGDSFRVTSSTGDILQGVINVSAPPRSFDTAVEAFNFGIFRIMADAFQGSPQVQIWVEAWDVGTKPLNDFVDRWAPELRRVLGVDVSKTVV